MKACSLFDLLIKKSRVDEEYNYASHICVAVSEWIKGIFCTLHIYVLIFFGIIVKTGLKYALFRGPQPCKTGGRTRPGRWPQCLACDACSSPNSPLSGVSSTRLIWRSSSVMNKLGAKYV